MKKTCIGHKKEDECDPQVENLNDCTIDRVEASKILLPLKDPPESQMKESECQVEHADRSNDVLCRVEHGGINPFSQCDTLITIIRFCLALSKFRAGGRLRTSIKRHLVISIEFCR